LVMPQCCGQLWLFLQGGSQNSASLQDLRATRGVVTFTNSSRSAQMLVPLAQDGPELEELFDVELANPSEGSSLGSISRSRITIAENGHSRGLCEFGCLDRYGRGNVNGREDGSVALMATHSGGLIGVAQVTVRTTTDQSTELLGRDFVPFEVVPTFAEGETSRQVQLRTKMPTVTETETVIVELLSPVNADINEEHGDCDHIH